MDVEHDVLTRVRDQDGMTLVEMLVAMTVALVISFSAFALIETVMRRSGEISSRVETTQRARSAMDTVTRELRSQVCVVRADPTLMTSSRSIFAATASSVTFFADTADESWRTGVTTMPIPTLRSLTLTGSTLVERIRPGVNDTVNVGVGAVTYATTPDAVRTLLEDAALFSDASGTTPLFRYYAFNTATPPEPKLLLNPGAGSLTEAQLQSVARIAISFRVLPAGRTTLRGSTVLQDDIYVRTADPNSSTPKPTCI